ncbi:MAG: TIGR00159 family protein, partial [Candidatus Omnitrophota bacterium]
MEVLANLLNWKAIIEILILWFVIYRIFLFLKGTKAVYLLRGIVILVVSFFIFQRLGFHVL